jgi:dipeptidyl-peptidase 4
MKSLLTFRQSLAILGICLISVSAIGQKRITMSDAILQERSKFRPTSLSQLQWIPDTQQFSYTANGKVVKAQAKTPTQVDTLDLLAQLNQSLRTEAGGDSLVQLPQFTWQSKDALRFAKGEKYYAFDTKAAKLTLLASTPPDADRVDVHTIGNRIAYTQSNALFIADGTKQIEVARSEKDGILYGTSVHRDEFGISKGTYWSPDGNKLAFYRMDESMVTQYPIYILDSMPAQPRLIRYPYAGATSHQVQIGIYHLADKSIRYLQTGLPADQYLTNVAWTPDNQYIFVAVVNREQNHMWLRKYNAQTGAFIATLLEEEASTWVEPEHPAEFLPDGRFILQSEKDGYNHLYLHAADGRQMRQLTTGKRVVTLNAGFDTKHTAIIFQWADSTGLNRYYSRVTLDKGQETLLTNEPGTHTATITRDGDYLIDDYNSLTVPRIIQIRAVNKPERTTTVLTAIDPNTDYAFGKINISSIRSASGFDLNARTILPHGFDATKKYPVIVYVYNGPHVQLVTNTWMAAANLWMQRFAQEGFIVYTIDGRGSSNRGKAFESAIHRQAGTCEVADQLAGIAELKKQASVDADRIAVYGWSYGGFMTTSMLTRPEAKGVFKCGVAGGAVTDWKMYEIMYTERYMDTPQENPDGYKQSSTFTYLPNLSVPLLMIHGTSDDVVTWQHTLRYTQECVRKGIQLDYFPYSEHLHNVRGKDRVHLFEKIEKWLMRELK